MKYSGKYFILRVVVIAVFAVIIFRLFHIQIIDNSYKLSSANNSLRYEVASEQGGIVVFSDIYYPGWTATVDGKDVPVARANYILRAISVPAGKHEVVMTFDPQTVHITETIAYSALALLGLIILSKIILLIYKKIKCQK